MRGSGDDNDLRLALAASDDLALVAAWGIDGLRCGTLPEVLGWRRDGALDLLVGSIWAQCVWRLDPSTGSVRLRLRQRVGLHGVRLSRDGESYYVPGDECLERRSVDTHQVLDEGQENREGAYAVSPDGSHFAMTGDDEGTIALRRFRWGEATPIEGWRAGDDLVVFSDDGASLLLASAGRIACVDVATARVRASFEWDEARPRRAEWVGATAVELVSPSRGLIRWWIDEGRTEVRVPAPPAGGVVDARRRGERSVLVFDGTARWFDGDAWVCERTLSRAPAFAVASPDLRFVVDLAPPAIRWCSPEFEGWEGADGPLDAIQVVALRGDATAVAAASGVDVAVWDVASGELLARFELPAGVSDLRFHPSGARLMGCDREGAVVVWDVASGREHARHPAPSGGAAFPWRLSVSPDGDRVVRWCADATPDETGEVATARASALAFEPDGARLALERREVAGGWAERLVRVRPNGGVEALFERAVPTAPGPPAAALADDGSLLLRRVPGGRAGCVWEALHIASGAVTTLGDDDDDTWECLAAGPRRVAAARCGVLWLLRADEALRAGAHVHVDLHDGRPPSVALARGDRALALGFSTGSVLVYLEASFEEALASLAAARDLPSWVATLASAWRPEALARTRALLAGYLRGELTPQRWALATGRPSEAPSAIDAAVHALWDTLVCEGLAEPSLRVSAPSSQEAFRRWARQPRWSWDVVGADGHVRANHEVLLAAVDVLRDPCCPRRDAFIAAIAHAARDHCNAALAHSPSFTQACAAVGRWAKMVRRALPDADVRYLERVGGYARRGPRTRDEAAQMARDLARCADPGPSLEVRAATRGWSATLIGLHGPVGVTVDAQTGEVECVGIAT